MKCSSVFVIKKVEKNYKFFSEINHDGKNSVLYPLDTLKRNEIAFAVNKISPECFENWIYKGAYFCILLALMNESTAQNENRLLSTQPIRQF